MTRLSPESARFIENEAFLKFQSSIPADIDTKTISRAREAAMFFLDTNSLKWYNEVPDPAQKKAHFDFLNNLFGEMNTQFDKIRKELPAVVIEILDYEDQFFEQSFSNDNPSMTPYLNRFEGYIYWTTLILDLIQNTPIDE